MRSSAGPGRRFRSTSGLCCSDAAGHASDLRRQQGRGDGERQQPWRQRCACPGVAGRWRCQRQGRQPETAVRADADHAPHRCRACAGVPADLCTDGRCGAARGPRIAAVLQPAGYSAQAGKRGRQEPAAVCRAHASEAVLPARWSVGPCARCGGGAGMAC
ncbi:hypothetical protein G6F31_018472 [Rhizopus arrhizus]|nr:hypothetical protein G6F31_018472 [Rhizopus arrhizus]